MTNISGDYGVDPEDYKLDEIPQVFAYIAELSVEAQEKKNHYEETKHLKEKIDTSTLYVGSSDFINLLTNIECEFDFEELFTNPQDMPMILADEGVKGYNNKITYKETIRNNQLIKLCGLAGLLFFYYKSDEPEKLKKTFEAHLDVFDTNRDRYLTDMFRSYIGYSIAGEHRYGELSEPIEYAYSAYQKVPENHVLKINLSEAIIKACELRFDYQPEINGLPGDREELLQFAVEEANNAKQFQPEFIRVHTTLARGNALLHNFDEARANLGEAIIKKEPNGTKTSLTESRLEELQRNINSSYEAYELEQNVQNAKDNLTDIEEEFESLQSEFKSIVARYRRNNLSFIGFFAALITLVVASVQIIEGTESNVQESGQLIMMLSGGMLIAFGGFGLTLLGVSDNSKSYLKLLIPPILIFIMGVILIIIGYNL